VNARGGGDGPWRLRYLDDEDYDACYCDGDERQLEWSSDVENGAAGGCNRDGKDDTDDDWEERFYRDTQYIEFLGFHPFKEVVFLHLSRRRGIAYHLDSSKIQDMGSLQINLRDITDSILMPFP
jgi:hypothetical protein